MAWSGIRNIITYIQDTAPGSPLIGETWYDTINKICKCWVNQVDGDATPQWRPLITYTSV